MATKQQFNTYLPSDLVRRLKHHSIDAQLSLSDLMEKMVRTYLAAQEMTMNKDAPSHESSKHPASDEAGIKLQPMVHVEDMARALDFYTALGAKLLHGSRDGDFALIRFQGAELSLLAHPPNPEQNEGRVELNFESTQPLEEVEARLRKAGVTIAQPTSDEGFGKQLQVKSPDGLLIKINQLEPDLYR